MKMREKIFKYVKDQYKTEPDYPFSTFPDYPVLRHGDNGKWFDYECPKGETRIKR